MFWKYFHLSNYNWKFSIVFITEIKFSSPAEGEIRQISDPIQIAKSMISGGAQALSILTQPYLFNGSPEYFIKIRKNVKIPLLMKDIIIDTFMSVRNQINPKNRKHCFELFGFDFLIDCPHIIASPHTGAGSMS